MFDTSMFLAGIMRLLSHDTYGKTLEQYIVSNHPKDTSDIEKLTEEWQRVHSKGWLS